MCILIIINSITQFKQTKKVTQHPTALHTKTIHLLAYFYFYTDLKRSRSISLVHKDLLHYIFKKMFMFGIFVNLIKPHPAMNWPLVQGEACLRPSLRYETWYHV